MLTTKNEGGLEGVERGMAARRSMKYPNDEFRMTNFFPRRWLATLSFLLLAVALSGCKPPGPKALLDGRRLIEHGQYEAAVERLKTATTLLSTNAQAWNYLGLANHQAGHVDEAVEAYKKALALDQNLVEVRYNLGCLWLEQNRPDLAKAELTAYTLHRGESSPEGFVKLGEAQLGLRDLVGAERSFNQARTLDAQNPEALNDMGVVQMQRNKVTEAGQFFNAALRAKPDYAPAILNLAIVLQHLNNRQAALERYHDYLRLTPRPANWDDVNAAAQALEQGSSPAAVAAPVAVPTPRAAPTNAVVQGSAPRPATTTPARSTPPANNSRTANQGNVATPEVTQVAPEPVIRGAQDTGNSSQQAPSGKIAESPRSAEHRSFLSRVNPANLFRSEPKTTTVTPDNSANTTIAPLPTPEPPAPTYPRYPYHSLKKPANGDRAEAAKAVNEGFQAQQAKQYSQAIDAYKRATKADPGYFDPYYNLGVVSTETGNVQQALLAYEMALAIQPDSHNARFNFALVLKRANYPADAADELEKVLAKSPNDENAHYALGNIYAQQLRQPAKAREHYQKVLELNPTFPQATAIHNWLWANPR